MHFVAGICAAKALVQLLCERFNDLFSLCVLILTAWISCGQKFCVQEVLMHICLPMFVQRRFSELNDTCVSESPVFHQSFSLALCAASVIVHIKWSIAILLFNGATFTERSVIPRKFLSDISSSLKITNPSFR
jgi:hypothetical protein